MTEPEQEIAHLQELRAKHRRNIRTLEETLANYGMTRPLKLINELEFEQEQLRQVERRLEKLAAPADPGEAPTATALGDFFTTIKGVKMDLATFEDFLARLRKDELAFEQVGARRWRAKWYGIETGYVIALPIGDELELDFYLMKWDQDPQPVA